MPKTLGAKNITSNEHDALDLNQLCMPDHKTFKEYVGRLSIRGRYPFQDHSEDKRDAPIAVPLNNHRLAIIASNIVIT